MSSGITSGSGVRHRPVSEQRKAYPPLRKMQPGVGGEFELSYVPENLAKAVSLKKNYGSITVRKTRKAARRKDH